MKYKILFSLFIFFGVLELALRLTKVYYTNEEKQGFEYESRYVTDTLDWFHTWTPNNIVNYGNTEFKYINYYNNLGHREIPTDSFSSENKKLKIICIGDSFTEGDGAPYDSSWVKCVERIMNKGGTNYSFYNAGVCGSDVFYDYKMLTNKLIKLKPKFVIAALNYSDVYDVICRGGDERFNQDSTTTYKAGPYWEWAFRYSHLIRALSIQLMGCNNYLIPESELAAKEDAAIILIKNKVKATNRFCEKNGIEYRLIIHPHPLEIQLKENKLTAALANESFVINLFSDLHPFYQDYSISEYSWPINQHFNGAGYLVMGTKIAQHLLELPTFIAPEN